MSMDSFAYYTPLKMSCTPATSTNSNIFYYMISYAVLFVGIPIILIIATNIMTLHIAITYKRTNEHSATLRLGGASRPRTAAVITISCICWIFVISWVPGSRDPHRPITISWVPGLVMIALKVNITSWFYIFQYGILSVNVVLNPVIYTITNKGFREFLTQKTFKVLKLFKICSEKSLQQTKQNDKKIINKKDCEFKQKIEDDMWVLDV